MQQHEGIGPARAAAIAAAFELGRRGAWSPPKRGDRLLLEPARVHELLRHAGHAESECFFAVLLDAPGRFIKTLTLSKGSLHACPVEPRDVMREAIRANAYGVVPGALPPKRGGKSIGLGRAADGAPSRR